MKRLIAISITLVLAAAAVPAEAGLGIKVRGGYSYMNYGDFNDWVDAFNEDVPSGSPTIDNIKWIPEVSAELTFPILPTFSGGIGIGYLSGKSDYGISLGGSDNFSYLHKVKAMPVLLNMYWEPPLVSINPFVYGGLGFYRTNLEFEYWLTAGGDREGYSSELDKWGFGLQAGGGVRIALMPTMSLDIGVQGRWADISGFEGTATNQDGDSKDVYLGKGEVDGYNVYGPMEQGSGIGEASVDLSGFTIFVGLTIGL
jgi:opacity protein-like surface antigen